MTAISFEALGISKEELTEKLLDRLAEDFATEIVWDEDGDPVRQRSSMARKLRDQIATQIDASVKALGEQHVIPRVSEMIEGLVLQKTNEWGERAGNPVTFIEYLTQRAEAFLSEPVDFRGEPKTSSNSYDWRKATTRIAFMIDRHLHISIETAMKRALADANASIAAGLNEAVKVSLANATAKLKVAVTTN